MAHSPVNSSAAANSRVGRPNAAALRGAGLIALKHQSVFSTNLICAIGSEPASEGPGLTASIRKLPLRCGRWVNRARFLNQKGSPWATASDALNVGNRSPVAPYIPGSYIFSVRVSWNRQRITKQS